jgi:hypothetical protein
MTYSEAAYALGFELCAQEMCNKSTLDHRKGTLRGSTLHWTDRRVTKPGLRRFLMLAASHDIYSVPRWALIWNRNVWVVAAAEKLRVRLPSRYSDEDRAKVAWELRDTHDPTYEQQAALRWAGRRNRLAPRMSTR